MEFETENRMDRAAILNKAGVAGLMFGAISGSYLMLSLAVTGVESTWPSLLLSLLWFAKLVGCIWLMDYLMRKMVASNPGVGNSDTFKFGVATAFFSALITAALSYVSTEFLFTSAVATSMDQLYQIYGRILDSNTMSMFDSIVENYSVISFFSQLVWCFIYGLVLSSILSRRIPAPDPFRDFRNAEGNNNENAQ